MHNLAFLSEWAARALLFGMIGFVTVSFLRRRGAATQHAIWRAVLTAMLALPVLTMILPPLAVNSPRVVINKVTTIRNMALVDGVSAPAASGTAVSMPLMRSAGKQSPQWITWAAVTLAIYLAVSVLLLSRMILQVRRGMLTASAAKRVAIPLMDELGYPRPDVRESTAVTVPFAIGWRSPVIVVPADWRSWDEFKLRSVLVHELAHIRRGDWLTSLAAAINRSLYWFHPVAWWLEARIAALAEEACDASAIRCGDDAPRYAAVVLDFAKSVNGRQLPDTGTAMARTSMVGRRIHAILESKVDLNAAASRLPVIAAFVLAIPALYAAGTFEFQDPLLKTPPTPYSSMSHIVGVRAVLADGCKLNADSAAHLEAELIRNPDNLTARIRLLSYYTQWMVSPDARTGHLLWLIQNHPDSDIFQLRTVATSIIPDYSGLNSPDIERTRALWLQQAERYATNPRVLANAAGSFAEVDGPAAFELIRRARRVDPDNPAWTDWLGVVYAYSVRSTFAGGRPRSGTAAGRKQFYPPLKLPLDQSVSLKTELEISLDVLLLGSTAESLLLETAQLKRHLITSVPDPELDASEIFGHQLLLRAQQLDPGNPRWRSLNR
jgi:beta-lactamase regulating signal transducer with metallopeptidase domain